MSSWFLIIVMISPVGSFGGFGGISVTKMDSESQCRAARQITLNQINSVSTGDFEGGISVTCQLISQ